MNFEQKDLSSELSRAFLDFSGYNIQRRGIPDVRDALKWGGRQLLHSQFIGGFNYNKPFKKAAKSVSQAMGFSYTHGNSSAYGTFIRMGKPFAYRYPLQDVKGNYGTLMNPKDHSADRYVEMRGSELAYSFLTLLNKDTIPEDEWEETYDGEDIFPKVLPQVGMYNIVNGWMSISSGMSSSCPQFNIADVNEALIHLLWNPDCDFSEIYCRPDFATGAILLNEEEVKESLKYGHGKACKLRAVIDYDTNTNELVVTELPYSVYTNTICEELNKLLDTEEGAAIEEYNDYTGKKVELRIKLKKNANVKKVLSILYKNTSLQSYYSINLTMLDNGKVPKIFGWKEALQAHLDHEKLIYKRAFEYDLKKLKHRLMIVEGILIALARIEEVIQIIRQSASTKDAITNLCAALAINEEQAKAIVDIKLGRLAHLEVEKFEKEKAELIEKINKIEVILNDENALKKEIEKGLRETMKKYADSHRTQIMNIESVDDTEPIEKKELLIHYTNLGNIYTTESSTLLRARRGTKGTKVKLADNEVIVKTLRDDNFSSILAFTSTGRMHHIAADSLPINSKININQLFSFENGEIPTTITTIKRRDEIKYFVFVTKQGMIKKTEAKEYDTKRKVPIKAINLKDDDEVVNVFFINNEKVSILTFNGNCVIINTEDITPIGRASMGVRGIKLAEGDYVIDAKPISNFDKTLITLSENGLIKKTSLDEFPVCTRGTKGKKITGVRPGDRAIKFLTFDTECGIIVIVKRKAIKISSNDVSELSRAATGVKAISLNEGDKAIDLIKESIE